MSRLTTTSAARYGRSAWIGDDARDAAAFGLRLRRTEDERRYREESAQNFMLKDLEKPIAPL